MSLRGAASFYSDGAGPRLFRVVTKPAARCRAGAEGGRSSLSRRHPARLRRPRQVRSEGAPRRPPPARPRRGWVVAVPAAAAPPGRRRGSGTCRRVTAAGEAPPRARRRRASPEARPGAAEGRRALPEGRRRAAEGVRGTRPSLRPRLWQLRESGERCPRVRPRRPLSRFASAGPGARGRFGSRVAAARRGGPGRSAHLAAAFGGAVRAGSAPWAATGGLGFPSPPGTALPLLG